MKGFEFRDTGIGAATNGIAGIRIIRSMNGAKPLVCSHTGEFYFFFILEGKVTLICEGQGPKRMEPGDSCVIPAGQRYALTDCSNDMELLEATFPAELELKLHTMSVESLMNIDH